VVISTRVGLTRSDPSLHPVLILRPANLDRANIGVIGCRRPFARTAAHCACTREFAGGSTARLISLTPVMVKSLSLTITRRRGTPIEVHGQLQFVFLVAAAVRFAHLACPARIAASDIVNQGCSFSGAETPGLEVIFGMGAWGMTETAAKFSAEIGIVAKTAGVGDLADGLACFQKRPAL
jgi:hypothetical protein